MANLTDLFPAASSTNVLEVLQGTCDGRSITVSSGTYTLSNVASLQNISTSYQEITGSAITYTPPAGTKYLSYRFDFMWDAENYSGISHYKINIDGTDIPKSGKTYSSNYSGGTHHHGNWVTSVFYVFDLTASSDDVANGKFANWTSGKTIRVYGREYSSSSWQAIVHYNVYYTTLAISQYTAPNLTLIAYS